LFARVSVARAESEPVRHAKATTAHGTATSPLQRAREQRRLLSEHRAPPACFVCARKCERALHAGAAAAQSPRLRLS
jgi:hypothetical protein